MSLKSDLDRATDFTWVAEWLDAVEAGRLSMSQRTRSSIDAHGGLEAAVAAARARGVHLVQLIDDNGKLLIAASREPFTVLC